MVTFQMSYEVIPFSDRKDSQGLKFAKVKITMD